MNTLPNYSEKEIIDFYEALGDAIEMFGIDKVLSNIRRHVKKIDVQTAKAAIYSLLTGVVYKQYSSISNRYIYWVGINFDLVRDYNNMSEERWKEVNDILDGRGKLNIYIKEVDENDESTIINHKIHTTLIR